MIDFNQDVEKRKELQYILFELARSQELIENDSARDQMYTRLEGLYYLPKSKENYRHLYSDVFSTIIAIKDDPAKGNIDILAQNLKMLWEKYQVKNKYENGDMINVSESIRKLYDHVSLDMARLTYSDYQKEISSLNEQVSNVKEEITQAQNAQNDLQKKTKDFEDQLANAQNEYISILGIFSAVVLAFVGGSMFSSSILENMSSANIYRLIFIADFLSFFVISLVYLLVSFIMKINGTPKTDRVQRMAIVRWWMKRRGKKDTEKIKQFFPIRTFYTVCLVVAMLDIAAWAVDLVRLVDYLAKSLPWLK